MSTAAIESPVATPATSEPSTDFGSKAELRELLFDGVEDAPLDASGAEARADGAEEKPAEKREEKAEVKADDDAEAIKAINRRSAERRKERQRLRAAGAAPARQAEPVPTPAEAAKTPQLSSQEKLAADATREVLQQIARLAGEDDASAAAGETQGRNPQRDALEADIRSKIDGTLKALRDGVGAENKSLVDELKAVRTQLDGLNAAREVRDHIARQFMPVDDKFPTLTDPATLRAYNKEHGTAHRDAIDLIHEAMTRTFSKHGYVPKVQIIAEAIERKLAAKSPEKTETKKPSRTLSSSLGSPPAARTDPDDRTAEEALADFNRRFELDD